MFKSTKTENWTALLVHTQKEPDEVIPCDYYSYLESPHLTRFYRLYKVGFKEIRNNGEFTHYMLVWKPVKVKPHCKQAFKVLCDAMKGLEEFLES